jgi:hypothetical protein
LFFAGGEDESVAIEHVGECRPWPQHFREKKAQCGLAAAAIVSVPKDGLHKQSFRSSDRFKAPCSVSDSTAAVSGNNKIAQFSVGSCYCIAAVVAGGHKILK